MKIEKWRYEPNSDQPEEIHVIIKVTESGRFAGRVSGHGPGEFGVQIFHSIDVPQRKVTAGEFTQIYPLRFRSEGKAAEISFQFSLFKDESGSAPEDVTFIFQSHPERDYDGHFLYEKLPPPDSK
jgi:hypothetical protein